MRGVEAALLVWAEVEKGAFASEKLRAVTADVAGTERILATTLVYEALRRKNLWEHLLEKLARRPLAELGKDERAALLLGTAGLCSLRTFAPAVLVSALVSEMKRRKGHGAANFVNAVLRGAVETAPALMEDLKSSATLKEFALFRGIPQWAASLWEREIGGAQAKRLIRLLAMKNFASLRLASEGERPAYLEELRHHGIHAWPSPLLPFGVRTASTLHPPTLPGFAAGRVSLQSESAMLVGGVVASFWEARRGILDMCAGRGGKTALLAQLLPEARIEAWELSPGKARAHEREMRRLGFSERVRLFHGDALVLEPGESPGMVLLDAPCTGSGTWGRHPEGKWRLSERHVSLCAELQKELLSKAIQIVAPGGHVVYVTCSLFREENEQVVADVLSRFRNVVDMPFAGGKPFQKGRPWGAALWPLLPWIEGFYVCVLKKRE